MPSNRLPSYRLPGIWRLSATRIPRVPPTPVCDRELSSTRWRPGIRSNEMPTQNNTKPIFATPNPPPGPEPRASAGGSDPKTRGCAASTALREVGEEFDSVLVDSRRLNSSNGEDALARFAMGNSVTALSAVNQSAEGQPVNRRWQKRRFSGRIHCMQSPFKVHPHPLTPDRS